MDDGRERVTVGVVNYNGIDCLPQTLESIDGLRYPSIDVILVDNNSSDNSYEWVRENYPQIECFQMNENAGPAAARNVLLEKSKTNYVFTIDNDIVLHPDALTHLMEKLKEVSGAAVAHPEILDRDDPKVDHYNGGSVHYLCQFVPRDNVPEQRNDYEVFHALSAGALLIKKELALMIDGFDSDYFFNWEDGDFTARLSLKGYLCIHVPNAIVYHKFKPRGTSKTFYMVRNRWFFILKLYSTRTIFLALPSLLLFEVSQALFLLLKGGFPDYVRGNAAVIQALPKILSKRRQVMGYKILKDREWLDCGDFYVSRNIIDNPILLKVKKAYGALFTFYWKLIRPYC